MTERGTEGGWSVIGAAVRSARGHLGERLASAYVIGSLAHGGFAPSVSDVDLALLGEGEVDDAIPAVLEDVRALGHPLGGRLSVFHSSWVTFTEPAPAARFPPIDRFDLMRHGILVAGEDRRERSGTVPAAAELRRQAVDSALRRVTPGRLVTDLERIEASGVTVREATKAVLWPVRLHHVCDTGEVTAQAAAVAHHLAWRGARHGSLVSDALAWRSLQAIPDPQSALRRIASELHDLHAEVLTHLSGDPRVPHREEIARRARQLQS